MQLIVYPAGDTIVVLYPCTDHPLRSIAAKDVPAGVPFLIVDQSDIPTDRVFREAWTADFSSPDGHGGDDIAEVVDVENINRSE